MERGEGSVAGGVARYMHHNAIFLCKSMNLESLRREGKRISGRAGLRKDLNTKQQSWNGSEVHRTPNGFEVQVRIEGLRRGAQSEDLVSE